MSIKETALHLALQHGAAQGNSVGYKYILQAAKAFETYLSCASKSGKK